MHSDSNVLSILTAGTPKKLCFILTYSPTLAIYCALRLLLTSSWMLWEFHQQTQQWFCPCCLTALLASAGTRFMFVGLPRPNLFACCFLAKRYAFGRALVYGYRIGWSLAQICSVVKRAVNWPFSLWHGFPGFDIGTQQMEAFRTTAAATCGFHQKKSHPLVCDMDCWFCFVWWGRL